MANETWQKSSDINTKRHRKSLQNRSLKGPKSRFSGSKIEVWRGSGRLLGHTWFQDVPWWAHRAFGLGILGRLGPKKVANMGPSWLPKRSQNRSKIDPKIDQFFDASWDRPFPIFGRFWEPKWSQVGTKIGAKLEVNFEIRFFEKTLFFHKKNDDFEGSGGRSWEPKSIKNR